MNLSVHFASAAIFLDTTGAVPIFLEDHSFRAVAAAASALRARFGLSAGCFARPALLVNEFTRATGIAVIVQAGLRIAAGGLQSSRVRPHEANGSAAATFSTASGPGRPILGGFITGLEARSFLDSSTGTSKQIVIDVLLRADSATYGLAGIAVNRTVAPTAPIAPLSACGFVSTISTLLLPVTDRAHL